MLSFQRFDSRTGQIGLSVVNGSLPLRRFFEAVLPRCQVAEIGPATRYTLRRNTASIMKILNLIELSQTCGLCACQKIDPFQFTSVLRQTKNLRKTQKSISNACLDYN